MKAGLMELGVALLACVVAYGFGRYAQPAKIVIKTETVMVEKEIIKWRTKIVRDQHEYKTVVEHKFPDGTLVRKSTDEKDSTTKIDQTENKRDSSTSSKVTEWRRSNWRIGALLGADIRRLGSGFDYGGRVERRLLGPIWFGAEGNSTGRVGASVSVEF